jgi:hypothetical protein
MIDRDTKEKDIRMEIEGADSWNGDGQNIFPKMMYERKTIEKDLFHTGRGLRTLWRLFIEQVSEALKFRTPLRSILKQRMRVYKYII